MREVAQAGFEDWQGGAGEGGGHDFPFCCFRFYRVRTTSLFKAYSKLSQNQLHAKLQTPS